MNGINRNLPRRTLVNPNLLNKLVAGITNTRDKALIMLMIDTGLRSSEVIQLDKNSVVARFDDNTDESGSSIGSGLTQMGKSMTRRRFFFTAETAHALTAYLLERRDNGGSALFATIEGARLHSSDLRQIFHGWCDLVGVERIGPRQLRHHFAFTLVNNGVPLMFTHLFGWKRSTTINIYGPFPASSEEVAA